MKGQGDIDWNFAPGALRPLVSHGFDELFSRRPAVHGVSDPAVATADHTKKSSRHLIPCGELWSINKALIFCPVLLWSHQKSLSPLVPLLLAPLVLYCFISLILHFTEMDKCIGNISSTGLSFLPPPARTGVPESFYFHSCWKVSPCLFYRNIPSFVSII